MHAGPFERRRSTLALIGRTAVVAIAALATCLPTHAADPYPAKPIRLLVGFAPGGGNDILARYLAHRL